MNPRVVHFYFPIFGTLFIPIDTLAGARENLIRIGLIAWRKPLYQVLSLDEPHPNGPRQAKAKPLSLAEILKKAAGGAT